VDSPGTRAAGPPDVDVLVRRLRARSALGEVFVVDAELLGDEP
jgi:hypothetical protein